MPLVLKNPQALKEFVGREIGVTEWFRITQERIAQFAEATEDRQWIHLDSGAGWSRIALWSNDRAWVSDSFVDQPVRA